MITFRRYLIAAKKQIISLRKYTSKVNKADQEAPIDYLGKLQDWCRIEEKNGFVVPPFKKSFQYAHQIAARDQNGEYSYLQLYLSAKKLGFQISNICGGAACLPVASICEPNILYIMVQWAIWMSGQVSMPLSAYYSLEMISDIIKRSSCRFIICTEQHENVAKIIAEELDITYCIVDHGFMVPQNLLPSSFKKLLLLFGERVMLEGALNNDFYTTKNALLLTKLLADGKYNTCMLTHKNIAEQIQCQQSAWKFTDKDVVMPLLPHYHMHDWINAVFCAGGMLVLPDQSNASQIWHALVDIKESVKPHVNFLTGTPAIYNMLINEYNLKFSKQNAIVDYIKHYCKTTIRAMVCGYATLSCTAFTNWNKITGQHIREHYSQRETGIVLANTTEEIGDLKLGPGKVGTPLPGVEVRLVNKNTNTIFSDWNNEINDTAFGELQIFGTGVIKRKAFQEDEQCIRFSNNFFKTGDLALFENGVFRIIGRSDTHIVQVANRYVYCPELENFLSSHPKIKQVLVGATSDPTWGERVTAICVLHPNCNLDIEGLKLFCNKFLPNYKIPTRLKIVEELPKDSSEICRKQIMSNLEF